VELRYACLLLADGRSLAFTALRTLLPTSVRRERRDSCGMTNVCPFSSLAPFQNYSPQREIDFTYDSPFLSASLSLWSLGTTLAKQVLLSLPLGMDCLVGIFFSVKRASSRDETSFHLLAKNPCRIK
jgi:hypothetical protein